MLKKFVLPATLLSMLILPTAALATTYSVKKGDTLKTIAKANGLTLSQLISYNPQIKTPDSINVGQNINLSAPKKAASISAEDKDLMARLVRAEAQGEPYAGKVAVATVVLNRLDHPDFPNTIHDVIYETYENKKYYAFSPVENGEINKPADKDSIRAVEEAIGFRGKGKGSLFFYNTKTSTSRWIEENRTVTITIANHTFAK